MAQIVELLLELIGLVQQVIQAVNFIAGKIKNVAQENVPFHITTQVDIIQAIVSDSTFGNQAIRTALDAYYSALAATTDDIQTRVIAMQNGSGTGVFIDALGSTAQMQVASSVWSWPIPTEGTAAEVCLADAHYYALYRSNYQNPIQVDEPGINYYQLTGNWNVPGQADPDGSGLQNINFNDIISTDMTTYDFVTRAYPSAGFISLGNGLPAIPDPGANTYFWVVNIPDDMFLRLKASVLAGAAVSAAPIWPGITGVTFGTPVALDVGVTVLGPLQGVLIALTSVPTDKAFFDFDGDLSYRNLGALTFQTDNGDDELAQSLGFTSAIYMPKTMAAADKVLIRTIGGVVGTATPFTIP